MQVPAPHLERCPPSARLLLVAALAPATLLLAREARAQSTYEDASARFVLDLPPGYSTSSSPTAPLVEFGGDGPTLVVHPLGDGRSVEEALELGQNSIAAAIPNSRPTRDPVDLDVNGHDARWVTVSGSLRREGLEIPLRGFVGSVRLRGGAVYLFSIYGEGDQAEWEERILQAFRTLRDVGEPVLSPPRDR